MKQREAYGVKFVVSGEAFDDYKGTLQEQLETALNKIEDLENTINGAYELINNLYRLCKEEISKTNNEEVKVCYAKLMFLIDKSMLIINS